MIAVTPGEPAGVGPDLVVRLAQEPLGARIVVIADPGLLEERARRLGIELQIQLLDPRDGTPRPRPGRLAVLPVALSRAATPGRPDTANAGYVLRTLQIGCDACLAGAYDALVTGPVHKGIINEAGLHFTGHTEFLASRCAAQPVMMLAAPGLRVALATTHLPLRQVSAAITREHLRHVLSVLHRDLRTRFGIADPRLLVCGLNPHAGEGGYLGREEIEVIAPVVRELASRGWRLLGPLPADTAFVPERIAGADAVLAMYHDQGLPVLKHLGFGRAVNITLGLPIIRTSVDHGTALDLAGTDRASPASLLAALATAEALCKGAGSCAAVAPA